MSASCPACVAAPAAMETAQAVVPNVFLSVPSIHCAVCIGKVERALNSMSGVSAARVNLSLHRVSAVSNRPMEDLVQVLGGLGYPAFPFDAGSLENSTDKTGKDLLLRLGVAGFAMMNVMLLSVAVWSGAEGATRDLFHLISAAIALPVVTYSGQPFFRKAWSALRFGQLNMDVPISLAILLAAGMSLYETLNSGHHAYFDAALSLTFFLLIGRYLEHQTRAKARSAAKDLTALEDHSAKRVRGTKVETVPVSQLRVGDQLLIPTGARVPVDGRLKDADAITNRSLLTGESDPISHDRNAFLSAGEVNLGHPIKIEAQAVGCDTSLRQMASMVETAENAKNTYTSLADKASAAYAPLVHILSGFAFLGWYITTGDLRQAINVAIAVLIITCPCALGLAVPAVSTAAIGRLFKMGFLIKSGTALERLAAVDTVIFDKTGTLSVPGRLEGLDGLTQENQCIVKALADASDHPLSLAISSALPVEGVTLTDLNETPGQGISAKYKGQNVGLGRADWLGGNSRDLTVKIGQALYPLSPTEIIRDGAASCVTEMANAGLRTEILSGDRKTKASAFADQIGVDAYAAELNPSEKFDVVHKRSVDGEAICMVGDGLNDTAALTAAHASIAPGTALEAARSAADVILIRDSFEDIPKLFQIACKSVQLSRQNFTIATIYNLIAIPIALAGFATPLIAALAMSTSSITVLLNAMRVWRTA